jgi:hypothetical protein
MEKNNSGSWQSDETPKQSQNSDLEEEKPFTTLASKARGPQSRRLATVLTTEPHCTYK